MLKSDMTSVNEPENGKNNEPQPNLNMDYLGVAGMADQLEAAGMLTEAANLREKLGSLVRTVGLLAEKDPVSLVRSIATLSTTYPSIKLNAPERIDFDDPSLKLQRSSQASDNLGGDQEN